jgi:hypothetical protein
MMVRDPWTTQVGPYYGATGLGQVATDPQVLYRELHATALALNQAQQRLTAGNPAELVNIANLREHFQQIRTRFLAESAVRDPDAITKTDRVILAAGNVLAAAPAATVAIVRPLADALADLLAYVGIKTIGALLPFGVLAVGIIYVLLFAEKSRIVRKAVRRV